MTTSRPSTQPHEPLRRRRHFRLATFAPAGVVAAAVLAGACTPAPGTTQRVSVSSNGSQLEERTFAPRLSGDGRFVAFTTETASFDRFGASQTFRKDRSTGKVLQVSRDDDGTPMPGRNVAFDISRDGRRIAFVNIVRDENGLNDIETPFVRDLNTNRTIPVAVTLRGTVESARDPDLSSDGRFVAFSSTGSDIVPGDTNGNRDVFVRDFDSPTNFIRRVSLTFGGNQIPDGGDLPGISADGRFVLFRTTQNLVGEDTDSNDDIYVRDRVQSTTTFESLAGGRTFARNADISGDGRFVVFAGESGPGVQPQTWVRDRQTHALTLISHTAASATVESNNITLEVDISDDGRHVAFSSASNDLVAGDTAGEIDIFVSSSSGGPVTRVSVRPGGQETQLTNTGGEVADAGKIVLFQSDDPGLVAGDTNDVTDAFVHIRR